MGGSKKQTIGYKYFLGAHMALCHGPTDRILRIRVDGKTAWNGNREGGAIQISAEKLFGGVKREGGVSGQVDIDQGGPDQVANTYLVARLGSLVPAFRGVCCAVLRQVYVGMSPYLKNWEFRLQRIHVRQDGIEQWYDAKAPIGSEFFEPQAFYFALDCSDSMNEVTGNGFTRLQNMKTAMAALMDYIEAVKSDSTIRVDIMISGWNYTSAPQNLSISNVDAAGFDSLRSFISGLTTAFGTDFEDGFLGAPAFFSTSPADARKSIFFLTDGLPYRDGSAGEQQAITDDALEIINSLSNVSVFAFNIDLADTTYTSQLDNTPDDGTPVVEGGDSGALTSVIQANLGIYFAMNPAHIIRECITDPDWGMGYQEADIDDAPFTDAADTLFSEGMGISIMWDRQIPIEDFIKEIVKHIDAALYVDQATGKFVLTLIRDDYTLSALPVLDPSNVESIENFSLPAPDELVNSVTVQYWDAKNSKDGSITIQDVAAVQMQGSVIGQTMDYPGFTNRGIATRVAQRDLKALSTPLASCTIYTNRDAAGLNIGSAFKLTWPDYDVNELVMRVTGIAYGDGRSNRIRIQATQDVFAQPSVEIVAQSESAWTDPASNPEAATQRIVQEAPYLELVRSSGQDATDDLLTERPHAGFVMATAVRPSDAAINANLAVDSGAGYETSSTLDFPPYAVISAAIVAAEETTVAISDSGDIDLVTVGMFGQIEDEIVKVLAVSSTQITIGRGALDTVPVAHAAGTYIIFWENYAASDDIEYAAGENLGVKILPTTGLGTLDVALAPADSLTLAQRATRPYPPGNLQVNGEYFPETIDGDALLSLSWAHRDRTQQTSGELIDFTDGNIGPESGVTYTLRIYDTDDALIKTVTGLAATSYLFSDEGSSGYIASASDYNGSAYQTRGSTPTGLSDGKQGLISAWVRIDGGDGTNLTIFSTGTDLLTSVPGIYLFRGGGGKFNLTGYNAASAFILNIRSSLATMVARAGFYHILMSFDLSNASKRHVYIDDVDLTEVGAFTDDTIDMATGNAAIGAETDGTSPFNGCISELFFHPTYLDLSIESNRRKFRSSVGNPADLGADGSTPLGVQPIIYVPTGDASGTGNKGSGGAFTTTGSLAACSSSPTVPEGLNGRLRFELESVRALPGSPTTNLVSHQFHNHIVRRRGYGFNYGYYYGGTA